MGMPYVLKPSGRHQAHADAHEQSAAAGKTESLCLVTLPFALPTPMLSWAPWA